MATVTTIGLNSPKAQFEEVEEIFAHRKLLPAYVVLDTEGPTAELVQVGVLSETDIDHMHTIVCHKFLPPQILRILDNPNVIKFAFGARGDIDKLHSSYGLDLAKLHQGVSDVRNLCIALGDFDSAGLDSVVAKLLAEERDADGFDAGKHDWENFEFGSQRHQAALTHATEDIYRIWKVLRKVVPNLKPNASNPTLHKIGDKKFDGICAAAAAAHAAKDAGRFKNHLKTILGKRLCIHKQNEEKETNFINHLCDSFYNRPAVVQQQQQQVSSGSRRPLHEPPEERLEKRIKSID
jgi:hypothetical protein